MSLSTPVAFIIFNRPDLTRIVFNAIRQAQPKQLFVIADGARFPEEAEKCQRAKDIIKQVDWDCQVLTNYADHNLGCRQRVSSGISWVFEQVEEAIILEDDCLPSPSFFHFCETLLDRYRDDERIMHISGNNFQFGQNRTDYSYYFSKYNHIWGWASWRRAWKHYDVEMKNWEKFKISKIIKSVHSDSYEQNYWLNIFEKVHEGLIDTWDYQWTYACWSQSGLSILPSVNLVSNIGFRDDATHTKREGKLANLPTEDVGEIYHPLFVIQHKQSDIYTFNYVFSGKIIKNNNDNTDFYKSIYNKITKILFLIQCKLAQRKVTHEKHN